MELANVHLLQGHNNKYYFVETDKSNDMDFVYEISVEFKEKEHDWTTRTTQIY